MLLHHELSFASAVADPVREVVSAITQPGFHLGPLFAVRLDMISFVEYSMGSPGIPLFHQHYLAWCLLQKRTSLGS